MDYIRSQEYEGIFRHWVEGSLVEQSNGFMDLIPVQADRSNDLAVNREIPQVTVCTIQQTRDNRQEKIYDGLNWLKAMIAHTPSQKETRKILTKT
jgi:hypothetical protein